MLNPQDITCPDEYEVTELGARRRLEALAAIGYSPTDLAQMLNLDVGHFADSRLEVPQYKFGEVEALFDRLQLVPGRNDRARVEARERGWAPPLAWDEDAIDDPDAQPQGMPPRGYRRSNRIPPDFLDMVLEHRDLGHYDEDIADAMGLTLKTLTRRLHRIGLPQRVRGFGTWNQRPGVAYSGRYQLRLQPHHDRLHDLTGVARATGRRAVGVAS